MTEIVIRRCPFDASMDFKAREIGSALARRMDLHVQIVDGVKGEFTVVMDGLPMLQRGGDELPAIDEVEAAVFNTGSLSPKSKTVSGPDPWLERPSG